MLLCNDFTQKRRAISSRSGSTVADATLIACADFTAPRASAHCTCISPPLSSAHTRRSSVRSGIFVGTWRLGNEAPSGRHIPLLRSLKNSSRLRFYNDVAPTALYSVPRAVARARVVECDGGEPPLLHHKWRRGLGRGGAHDAHTSQEISPLPNPLPAPSSQGEGATRATVVSRISLSASLRFIAPPRSP